MIWKHGHIPFNYNFITNYFPICQGLAQHPLPQGRQQRGGMESAIAWPKAAYFWQFNFLFNSLLVYGQEQLASGSLTPANTSKEEIKKKRFNY